MRLEWPLVIGSHFPAQYAYKHVHHFRLQRPNSLLFLTDWREDRGSVYPPSTAVFNLCDNRINKYTMHRKFKCVSYWFTLAPLLSIYIYIYVKNTELYTAISPQREREAVRIYARGTAALPHWSFKSPTRRQGRSGSNVNNVLCSSTHPVGQLLHTQSRFIQWNCLE